MSVVSDVRAAAQLWRALRRSDITVLHTHNPKPGIYGRILGRLAGIPVVVNTLHGFYATETDSWAKRAVVYGLEALAGRFSDAELHQNSEDLQLATRLRIVPSGRGRLLGNGIDLTRFDPESLDGDTRRRTRQEIGVGADTVVVGAVGRLVAEKGYLELFAAMDALGEMATLVVVGPVDPDKPDSIPDEVIAEAEARGVRFLGMRTDMERLYAAMDIFILPSHREGFPRAAMEAAAMRLPIVATDIRGCRQVVEPGVNGTLVPVARPDLLREAVRELAADSKLRQAQGNASRQIALERFDESKVVAIVMGTYREVLESKSLTHLMPAEMIERTATTAPRPARPDEAKELANLHFDLIAGGFLPRLGRRFMRVLYEGLLSWRGTNAFVVEDEGGVIGFVVAVDDVGVFYKWFIRSRGVHAAFAALPALLKPRVVRRALESFRYGGREAGDEIPSEVLSLGVAVRARGIGLSGRLLEAVLAHVASGGPDAVRVVVGADNAVAIRAYEQAGFVPNGEIEVHRGERSKVLVWRSR
jgi:glycosyltransferase involved in cell wall biosynthesis/ribosomal protein S18 acetylase RimI-like enzyme